MALQEALDSLLDRELGLAQDFRRRWSPSLGEEILELGSPIRTGRSEGACHRNGLFHSCACGRVAGVVWLLGSGGRLGCVVVVAHAPGVRRFSRYVSGDGA